MQKKCRYSPTPDEIVAACQMIRQKWSEKEHERRSPHAYVHWSIPDLSGDPFASGMLRHNVLGGDAS